MPEKNVMSGVFCTKRGEWERQENIRHTGRPVRRFASKDGF